MASGSAQFLAACENRRSNYALGNTRLISDEQIEKIVNTAVLHCPTAFNSQGTRVVLLVNQDHQDLWENIVKPAVKAVAPAEAWTNTSQKLDGFKAAYGTVLLYEDNDVVNSLQQSWPLYTDYFPQWSEHSNGMLTYVVWTALEQEGFGANLQHYNPLIDRQLADKYNIPLSWQLKGQLVFGSPEQKPKEKTHKPLDERVKVYGKAN